MKTLEAPIHRNVQATKAYWYLNNRFVVLADGTETDNEYSLVYGLIDPTGTPPAHVHDREDEVFYVLRGEGRVLVGDQEWTGGPGDLFYLPRGLAHLPIATTEVETLILTSPGSLLEYFREFMTPAAHEGRPSLEEVRLPAPEDMLRSGNHHGITYLPPAASVASWPIPEIHAQPRRVLAGSGEKLNVFGSRVTVKMDRDSTQGLFSIFEVEDLPTAAVSPYINREDSEAFYVLDGEYEVMVEWMSDLAKPGNFIFVPPGVVRGYRNAGHSVGRLLHITAKSGKEDFYREVHVTPNVDNAKFGEIASRHGIEFVG